MCGYQTRVVAYTKEIQFQLCILHLFNIALFFKHFLV